MVECDNGEGCVPTSHIIRGQTAETLEGEGGNWYGQVRFRIQSEKVNFFCGFCTVQWKINTVGSVATFTLLAHTMPITAPPQLACLTLRIRTPSPFYSVFPTAHFIQFLPSFFTPIIYLFLSSHTVSSHLDMDLRDPSYIVGVNLIK